MSSEMSENDEQLLKIETDQRHDASSGIDDDANDERSQTNVLFEALLDDARKLIPMIRAINITKLTSMIITKRGLKMTSQDDSKNLQASAFVERSLFGRYWMLDEDEPSVLCFSLTNLLKILTIFMASDTNSNEKKRSLHSAKGNAVQSLQMIYRDASEPLELRLKDDNLETKAKIATFIPQEIVMFSFDLINNPVKNKVIITADALKEFWKCMDHTTDDVTITMNPNSIEFSTASVRAEFVYEIGADSDFIEKWRCDETIVNSYKYSLLKMTIKALFESTKLSIRTDSDGLMCFQFIIKVDENNPNCFVEFFIIPNYK